MKTIGAAKFKGQCLALLDRLDSDGRIVTKHGKPVAQVIPYEQRGAELTGSMRGQIEAEGEIFSAGANWDAIDKS